MGYRSWMDSFTKNINKDKFNNTNEHFNYYL